MTQPTVFISYSHRDEKEKEELLAHLGVLRNARLIKIWSDDQIRAGADWEREIDQAISHAKIAILLISANFLSSEFILNTVVPKLLKHYELRQITIYPVIAKACAWQTFDWLTKMQVRPTSKEPIWGTNILHVDKVLTTIAEEVASLTTKPHPTTPSDIHKEPRIAIEGLEKVNKTN